MSANIVSKYYTVKGKDFVESRILPEDINKIDKEIDEVGEAIQILRNYGISEVENANRFLKTNTVLQEISNESDAAAGDAINAGISLFKKIYNAVKWLIGKIKGIFVKIGKFLGIVGDKAEKTAEEITEGSKPIIDVGKEIVKEAVEAEDKGFKEAKAALAGRASRFIGLFKKNKKAVDFPVNITNAELKDRVKAIIEEVESNKNSPEIKEGKKAALGDLVYKLKEEDWLYFGYNKRFEPFTPALIDSTNNAAEYGYRLTMELTDKLSPTALEEIMKKIIVGLDITKGDDYVKRSFNSKMIFMINNILSKIKLDKYKENITHDTLIRTLDVVDLKHYANSPDKLDEFLKAVQSNFNFEVDNANKDLFVPFSNQVITQAKIIIYINALKKSMSDIQRMVIRSNGSLTKYSELTDKVTAKSGDSILLKFLNKDGSSGKVTPLQRNAVKVLEKEALKVINGLSNTLTGLLKVNAKVLSKTASSYNKQIMALRNTPVYLQGD